MRETVGKIPGSATLIEETSDEAAYEWLYSLELYRDGEDWYVKYYTETGTCEMCGGSNEDIDKFDNEPEARAWFADCLSREFY